MASSAGYRKRMRHKVINYLVEQERVDDGWRDRPPWCTPHLWRSLLQELEAEGCQFETQMSPSADASELSPSEAGRVQGLIKHRHISPAEARRMVIAERPAGRGRRNQVRPAPESASAWLAVVDQAAVERGYDPRPRDLTPRGGASHHEKQSFAFFPQPDGSIKAEMMSTNFCRSRCGCASSRRPMVA